MRVDAEFWEWWVEGILPSVPLSLANPLHCLSPETSDPWQQLLFGVLRELAVPRGHPLTARLVTKEGGVGPW